MADRNLGNITLNARNRGVTTTAMLMVLVIALAVIFFWYRNQIISWTDAHSGLSSWVQAIGSVGTIAIAGWAVKHAHTLQSKQKSMDAFDENTRLLEVIFQLVGGAAQTLEKIYKIESEMGGANPAELASSKIEIDALWTAISRLDPSRLDRFEVIQAVLVTAMNLRKTREAIERIQSDTVSPMLEPHYLRNIANIAYRQVEEHARGLAKITDARGGPKISDSRPE